MGYRLANIGNGRRVGDRSSGPRTIGFDSKPRGLVGTNSNIRRMAGTNSTASDYKKNKQKKDNKKQNNNKPPYPPSQEDVPPEMKPYDPSKFKDKSIEGYDELVEKGDSTADKTDGGWTLTLYGLGEPAVLTTDDEGPEFGRNEGKYTQSWYYMYRDMFHIINVSSDDSVRLPTAPLENGMVKHDHKVKEPKKLTVTGWVERADTKDINELFENARTATSLDVYFKLSSPWRSYEKMYLQRFSSKVSTDKYDVYDYTLHLQELLIAESVTDKTSDPGKASNSAKGAAQGK